MKVNFFLSFDLRGDLGQELSPRFNPNCMHRSTNALLKLKGLLERVHVNRELLITVEEKRCLSVITTGG